LTQFSIESLFKRGFFDSWLGKFMKRICMALAAASVGFIANADASVFQNGGFETGPAPGSFITLGSGSTAITGWTVGGGGIDYIGSYWQPSDGSRSLDLNGNLPGSISQTFDVVSGQTYQVTFYLAGNTDGGPAIKTLTASIDSTVFLASFDSTGKSRSDMGWMQYSFLFTANGPTETLSFQSTTLEGNAYGPALDNVSVAAVPESSTWAMMILGFLGVGFVSYRRRGRVAIRFA
jgi:choice-of-anchor C domain-containing protein